MLYGVFLLCTVCCTQTVINVSSCEAELVALRSLAAEASQARTMLEEFDLLKEAPPIELQSESHRALQLLQPSGLGKLGNVALK